MLISPGKKPLYWALLALVILFAGNFLAKPSAALTGTSLESAGYSISSLEDMKFDDPCPANGEYPISLYAQEGDQKRRYAKNLAGSYNVVSAPLPYLDTAELVPLMWLQAFNTADIHGMKPTFETANGPVPFRQMAKHLVYRDKNITVFDVTAIERSEDIETVKNNFAAECAERSEVFLDPAFLNATDVPPGRKIPTKPILSVLDGTYRFDVITDMHRFLQENLPQRILPADAA
ncbi:MAG TPA: hypothetical protein VN626_01345 [Clostridia bacterium]|nr:hypothetical protein [Clostridia bacterium]